MIEQIIECVWCSSKRDFNKFIRNVDRKSTKIVDHVSIKNKLMKADPYSEDPSDSVVGLTIMSDINRFFTQQNHGKLIYSFKNLDRETVSNFISYVSTVSEEDTKISLVIIDREDYPQDGVLSQFESVKFIKND